MRSEDLIQHHNPCPEDAWCGLPSMPDEQQLCQSGELDLNEHIPDENAVQGKRDIMIHNINFSLTVKFSPFSCKESMSLTIKN
jgi:hypothetical protein